MVSRLDVQRMQFHKADGRNFDEVTVATVVFDDDCKFVTGGEKLVKMRLVDSSIERLGHAGFTVKSTFDLKPGKYLVRQVVRDSEGAHMAARNSIVVIPTWLGGKTSTGCATYRGKIALWRVFCHNSEYM